MALLTINVCPVRQHHFLTTGELTCSTVLERKGIKKSLYIEVESPQSGVYLLVLHRTLQ